LNSSYWSATELDISTTRAFRMNLDHGEVTSNKKVANNYVRCVRNNKKVASL